jgi:transcriptional regulator with XRE-family HTH domain
MVSNMPNLPRTVKVLTQIRQSRELTYRQLGEIIGKDSSYINRVEKDRYETPFGYINDLAKHLHITKLEQEAIKSALKQDIIEQLDF